MKIVILSTSIRVDRKSHRVSLFLDRLISGMEGVTSEIFDLKQANFPIFDKRLSHQKNPSKDVLAYSETIDSADAIIVVCPEYNGGYPAAFKNAFDLLYKEWTDKPIGIYSVSAGRLGGAQVMQKIQLLYVKVGALVIGNGVYVPSVTDVFDEKGNTKEQWMIDQSKAYIEKIMSKV